MNKFFLFRLSFPFTRKTQKGIKRSMYFDTTFCYKFDVNILWLLTSIIICSMNLKNKRKRRKNRSNWLWQFLFRKEVDHEMLVFYMTLLFIFKFKLTYVDFHRLPQPLSPPPPPPPSQPRLSLHHKYVRVIYKCFVPRKLELIFINFRIRIYPIHPASLKSKHYMILFLQNRANLVFPVVMLLQF